MSKSFKIKGSAFLKYTWVLFLAIVTCVLIFSPRSEDPSCQWTIGEITKVGVVGICWLIAILAFTPLYKKIGNKKLFSEDLAKKFSIALFGLIVLTFIVVAFLQQQYMIFIVITAVTVLIIYNTVKDRKKTKRRRKKVKTK